MNFIDIHSINPHNERQRNQLNMPSFQRLLAGVSINELKPNPLRCSCGHYPRIERSGSSYDARCPNECCDHELYNLGKTYQEAIFEWNQSSDTEFDPHINKIHPLAWFNVGFDSPDYLLKQINKIERTLAEIELGKLSTKESRLINIIRSWNHFAAVVAARLKKQNNQDLSAPQAVKSKEVEVKRNNKVATQSSKNKNTPNHLHTPDIDVAGPMSKYKHQIQIIGSAGYWCVEGHAVRVKICKHTLWTLPTYIVYVHNKGTRPGYQVRIDLRSLGIPYYSKMFGCETLYGSLSDALHDLVGQLKKIKHPRKLNKIIDRANVKSTKPIALDSVKGLSVIKSIWDSNHRVEVTFSAPNDHAKARFSFSIGGKTTLTHSRYANAIKSALKINVMHTRLACKKEFAHGVKVPINELDYITMTRIVDVVAEHFELSASDVAYYLTQLNPNVHIGYLTLSSLRDDNTLELGDYPMQIVSSQNKRGYLSGGIKKHDILNNAECVCIDSILRSNFDDYTYQADQVHFREASPEMALLLSKRAVEMALVLQPDLDEDFADIEMLGPDELVMDMQSELLAEIKANMSLFNGMSLSFTVENDSVIACVDGHRTQAIVQLDDWSGSVSAASTQALVLAYLLAKAGRLIRNKTEYSNKDLTRRYAALGISEQKINLNNVRFLASRASKCGMRNLLIKPSGRVVYHQKETRELKGDKRIFPRPASLEQFESIITELYPQALPFNEDERRLIHHTYLTHYTNGQ